MNEQPIDALFSVIAVATICALLTLGMGKVLGVGHKYSVPCSFTKIEGFSRVAYRATCEIE